MQWFAGFRFVGLAGDDASYLEDYNAGLARAVTQHYVEAEQGGTRYGFWLPGGTPVMALVSCSPRPSPGSGICRSRQIFRLEYEVNRLLQVGPSFLESYALRTRSG